MENTLVPQSKHGIMDYDHHYHHEDDQAEDVTSSFSWFSEDEEEDQEEDDDEASSNSVGSSSSSSLDSSSSNGPLFQMSSLISQLPFKRGLSKHFEGKSQSFTSLSNVRSLEDLIKPERPFKKRQLKSSKSYGWGLDRSLSRAITKKSSKGSLPSSFSSIKRHGSFLGSRQQRSGSLSGRTLLETIG